MSKHSGNAVWCWNTRQSERNIRGLLVWSLEFGTILFSGSDREPEDLPRLRPVNQKDNHTRKHSLLYRLFHSKRDHHLQNEHHPVLKNTWNKQVSKKKKKLQVRSRVVFLISLHTCYPPPHTHWPLERMQVKGASSLVSLFRASSSVYVWQSPCHTHQKGLHEYFT